ncbi:DJ-1/PfpI family protein [Aspergillus steynii IBT 23096]|uniref:DJ-1/PfpI family protein n=1 Tax=Aspergillus steynii IBT 23096 TaxID=1392250 RepID=A0A2I2GIV9_9EURO|nr:DJ-1/PfpI family protein [Aspergillus steynii IBT 23096]PLB52813.1 DJ-1/PfpI family protein [Aspergillus steynii IBT 23096]
MSPIDLRNPGRPIHVGVIVFDTVTEHLDVAPVGYFSSISSDFLKDAPPQLLPDELKRQAPNFVFHWVTEDGNKPANLTGNTKVVATDSFDTCPALDIVVLGAMPASYQPSQTELAFLRKSYEDCTALLLVCGGFQAALAAGILEGKTATAPRPVLAMVNHMAPGTNWVQKRYVRDGKVWTTGSLLNGFDMVAAFGREIWGGRGSFLEILEPEGAWPNRDLDYKDTTEWKM